MPYLGGKSQSGVTQRIINLIPPHEIYIEPFLGSGAIARIKRPARLTIGVDKTLAPNLALPAGVQLIAGCGIAFLENYTFSGGEFVYADPPYLHSTRRSRARYQHEMSDDDHRRLLRVLLALPCPVLLSGYPSALYDDTLNGWQREQFRVMTRGHTWATEVLWFNYPRPSKLHDLAHVGANYRERWRIEKRRRRWRAKFAAMPDLERETIFLALVDAMNSGKASRAISGVAGS